MRRVRVAVLLFLALAACGPLPRPFESRDRAENGLLRLADRSGIVVLPVAGQLPADPALLAEAMAAHLRRLNVPATTDAANRESRLLHGRASVRPGPAGRAELVLVWELWDLEGRLLGGYTQRRLAESAAGPADGERLFEGLAAQAAPAIVALVQEPPNEQAAIPGFPRARLVVQPLGAGPGDAADSLPSALRAELAAAGLPVAPGGGAQIRPDDLLVLGDIALSPPASGQQDILITWVVVAARDDAELGQVAQRNRVPAGSLDGPWGGIAREIARGATEGVVELLRRAVRPADRPFTGS